MKSRGLWLTLLFGISLVLGCRPRSAPNASTDAKGAAQLKADAVSGLHDAMARDLATLVESAKALGRAAPDGHGWDATKDRQAITEMRAEWRRCRVAYEHVEGVIAAMFPDLDASIDARYDDFLTTLGGAGDPDPFDRAGVTGMHAIERILWSNAMPSRAVEFERALPGYAPAAFPSTAAEAHRFKTELVQQLIDDVSVIEAQFRPAKVDPGVAWNGLVLLMNEQAEKINKASTGEEESRYAEVTLFDLRNNLEGTVAAYAFFRPWVLSSEVKDGAAIDGAITSGFAKLSSLYATSGSAGASDALAAPPATWSSRSPSEADLASPFGVLFTSVSDAVDADKPGTLVAEMNRVSERLGFMPFKRRG